MAKNKDKNVVKRVKENRKPGTASYAIGKKKIKLGRGR